MDRIILMGDIINSRSKNSKKIMSEMKQLVQYINTKHSLYILSPLTITLGDEFQSIIKTKVSASQIVIDSFFYGYEHGFDWKMRFVLYEGKVDTKINTGIAYEMLGEGLSNARTLLETKKKSDSLVNIHFKNSNQAEMLQNSFLLYNDLISSWKINERELVKLLISNLSIIQIAETLKKDRTSVWRKSKSLKISEYKKICQIINYIASHE
jgi:hypothetical protein